MGSCGHPLRWRRRFPTAQDQSLRTDQCGRWARADLRAQGAGTRRCRATLSSRTLRAGGRQIAYPDRREKNLGFACDHYFRQARSLRYRFESPRQLSGSGHQHRTYRRSAAISLAGIAESETVSDPAMLSLPATITSRSRPGLGLLLLKAVRVVGLPLRIIAMCDAPTATSNYTCAKPPSTNSSMPVM